MNDLYFKTSFRDKVPQKTFGNYRFTQYISLQKSAFYREKKTQDRTKKN